MVVLYNLSILLLKTGIRVAGIFHSKARAFVTGRKGVFAKLNARFAHNTSSVVWFHCASLGEFEQARPLIEAVKTEYPHFKVLLTFFSPSGYEIRKNYQYADEVAYLPLDTAANARRFVSIVKPAIAIFIKYEFWYHYSQVLKEKNIPILSTSSIFRKDQMFFKGGVGNFYRRILQNFTHFFVQNSESEKLLQSIGITNVTVSGDTRFDRVRQIVDKADRIAIAEKFKGDSRVFVVGSSWSEDLDVLIPFINEKRLKFIIAPHEISEQSITGLENALQVKSVRYSEADENVEEADVLIIDNIGLLSRLYRYGEFAYVGGAFGKGLHNILEAACYGVPILFGNKNYQKFQEAVDLINRGGAFEVKDFADLKKKYEMLNVPSSFLLACDVTRQYVDENLGATERIMSYCRPLLSKYATVSNLN